jgi:hypothetical protein
LLDRPTTVSGRADYDLNQRAIKHWPIIYHMMVEMHGRPLAEVQRLNPNYVEPKHGVHRQNAPRLVEFHGPGGWPNEGSWQCLGNGASGADLIDLVAYLGETDRRTAGEWLAGVVRRIVSVEAA